MSHRGAVIFMPSDMKKSVRKKSRSGSVLAVTWTLYGKAAMLRPATSAPISLDRPSALAAPATAAHQPTLIATTISGALAIDAKIRPRTNLLKQNPAIRSRAVPPIALRIGPIEGLAKFGWNARTKIA